MGGTAICSPLSEAGQKSPVPGAAGTGRIGDFSGLARALILDQMMRFTEAWAFSITMVNGPPGL